jgi:GDP/UDP-N,N'-diacetylbacillosamine 2-epimerase (hydrolysing)
MKRKICLVTGSRAEYGLLKPLLEGVHDDEDLQLQLVVTGMHLSREFGLTYREIEEDGFSIDAKIDIRLKLDNAAGVASSMGYALVGCTKAYEQLNPDIVVVLGDRFEILSVAIAALISKIPLAHINGGELTEGAFDDSFRHSITKMSQLHFTSTESYRSRVIQLGEHPDRVFNVGALSIDAIQKTDFISKETLERDLKFKFNKRNLLVTFHPVTLDGDAFRDQFNCLLAALDAQEDTQLIFTKTNADSGGRAINQMIDEYVAARKQKAIAFTSLGYRRYASLMRLVDAVIGNSSSGIVEAPYFKIPTVNIGDRQKGRMRVPSIIDCLASKESITKALKYLYSQESKDKVQQTVNPYGDGSSASAIKNILKTYDLRDILKKRFYDLIGQGVLNHE